MVEAARFTEAENILPFTLEGDQNPLGDDKLDIIVAPHESWVSYGDLDLNAIGKIVIGTLLNPEHTEGGTIELRSGHPSEGTIIGSVTIDNKPVNYGYNFFNLELDESKVPGGIQPVYFRFIASSGRAEAMLGALVNIEFMPNKRLMDMSR